MIPIAGLFFCLRWNMGMYVKGRNAKMKERMKKKERKKDRKKERKKRKGEKEKSMR